MFHNGKIAWFNASSGKGMIRLDDSTLLYCHFSSISEVDKHNYQWPTEFDQGYLSTIADRRCRVRLYSNAYSSQAEYVEMID